eukprot:m.150201 g.150201  ORF g.150201 m.150201 type:complete len:68 (+) comp13280_c0_seq13:47-250(+)
MVLLETDTSLIQHWKKRFEVHGRNPPCHSSLTILLLFFQFFLHTNTNSTAPSFPAPRHVVIVSFSSG